MTEKSLATWRDENTVEAKIVKMKVKRYSCRTSRRVNQVTNRTEIQQIQDSCCADSFQLSKPSRKPWRFTKLQFIDISVTLQKSIPTVRVPHVQHKDKSPKRTVQKAEERVIFDL